MNRGASAAVIGEWARGANVPAHLLELHFDAGDGGPVYKTDSYRAVSWSGNTYVADGGLLDFSGLSESAELRATDVRVRLSGVDQTTIATLLARQWLDRRLVIRKLFFDQSSEQLLVDPVPIHDGRMDEPTIEEDGAGGASVVTVVSRDQFADFERLGGRHTNPVDQQAWFPNDEGFRLVASIAGKQVSILWGAPRP